MTRRSAGFTLVALLCLVVGCAADDGPSSGSPPSGSTAQPDESAAAESGSETSIPVSSIVDRVLPVGDEPDVLGPLGETDVEFETDDGSVQIGEAEVPEVVGDDFPVPGGLDIQLASASGDDAGFSGVTDSTFDELLDFFEAELPAAGYDVVRSQFVDGTVAVIDFSGGSGNGQLAISSAPGGGRSVLVTFQR